MPVHTLRTYLAIVIAGALWPSIACAQTDLQELVRQANDKSVVTVEPGVYRAPLTLDRDVSLKGQDVEKCILVVEADEPAISVTAKEPVTIEGLTIKWQLATSNKRNSLATAIFTKDAKRLTLRNCRVIATGNSQRCPSGLACTGFSNVVVENCRFEGFNFAINYGGGAEGTVADSLVLNPGHCGITVTSGSKTEVMGNVITGSAYHGLRSTGGTLLAHDNLIIKNKNRGIYLGNKSASGRIHNNVILGNGTGISAFAQTDVTIERNAILENGYSGLDARDSCSIKVRDNLFVNNSRGIVLFNATGKNHVEIGRNSFWKNETTAENLDLPESSLLLDPHLKSAAAGDFSIQTQELIDARQGLSDPQIFPKLWERYERTIRQD